jgi:hypothetical protein
VTSLQLAFTGHQLVAAASDAPEPRTVEGILVPWGEGGRTNLGRGVSVRRGSLTIPDRVVGTMGHDRDRPVSRLVAHEDRPEGLWGRLRIAETPDGDLLLAEVRAGIRDGLSVDAEVQTNTAGEVHAGRLDYVAHVPVGAFDSAGVHSLAATLTTGDPETVTAPTQAAEAPVTQEQFAQLLAGLQSLQAGANVGGGEPSAAQLLGTGNAPGAPGTQQLGGEDALTEAARLSAAVHQDPNNQQLLAALQDITASGLPLFQEGESRLGERLWEGTADTSRPFVDLMAGGELTAMRYPGWEWTKLPEMEEWAGNKQPINGNAVGLRQVFFDAKRCAAGWDVDRKYRDFPSPEFWSEFYTEQTRAYRRLSNKWAAEATVANALDVTDADNYSDAVTPGPLPADAFDLVPAGGVATGVTQILRAAAIGRVIMENTPRVEQGPDYILVNAFDWLALADLTTLDLPAFLQLLGVNPAGFRPTTKVPRGGIVMGAKGAQKFRELPGSGGKGSPIRVEALDVARGGVDSAVYGYVGISLERPGGVISVPLAPEAP